MKNYPHFVDINRDGIFAKVFTTPSGNEEFCSPTGRELRNSNTPMDWWIEFEDSNGNLYYGR